MSSRNWCFTINNPTEQDFQRCTPTHTIWNGTIKTLVWMLEHSSVPASGETTTDASSATDQELTPHIQGYVEFTTSRKLLFLKTRMPRAHFEVRKGSAIQAIQYCFKELPTDGSEPPQCMIFLDGSLKTVSELKAILATKTSQKGAKRKQILMEMKKMLEEGSDLTALANHDFPTYLSHFRGLQHYQFIISRPRDFKTQVIICWGPTGTGKSRYCQEQFPGAFWKQKSNWWDGYQDHETVIVDEFYGWISFDVLLRLCDRYPLAVETKGGQTNFRAKTIVFTSNKEPSRWYKDCYFESFKRRVDTWKVFPIWGEHETFTDYNEFITSVNNNTFVYP